ncbi:hypothetical protein PI23P_02632 [Polaribacter irgensii 23-P]|uniref:Uncharacterized protein n=1 Tax=Polaribacter irgensii 23-P TaxID=313594 RepID=A4BWL3_9FLAO|nr:hypothetical protein PI23P_02632 [Polaribacter irgensii 23-P]
MLVTLAFYKLLILLRSDFKFVVKKRGAFIAPLFLKIIF